MSLEVQKLQKENIALKKKIYDLSVALETQRQLSRSRVCSNCGCVCV